MKTKLLKGVLLLSVILLTVFATQLQALAVTAEEQAAIDTAVANADTNPEALATIIAAHPELAGDIIDAAVNAFPDIFINNPDLATVIADAAFEAGANMELVIASINNAVPDFAEGYSPPDPGAGPGWEGPGGGRTGAPGGTPPLTGGCASCT